MWSSAYKNNNALDEAGIWKETKASHGLQQIPTLPPGIVGTAQSIARWWNTCGAARLTRGEILQLNWKQMPLEDVEGKPTMFSLLDKKDKREIE